MFQRYQFGKIPHVSTILRIAGLQRQPQELRRIARRGPARRTGPRGAVRKMRAEPSVCAYAALEAAEPPHHPKPRLHLFHKIIRYVRGGSKDSPFLSRPGAPYRALDAIDHRPGQPLERLFPSPLMVPTKTGRSQESRETRRSASMRSSVRGTRRCRAS